MSAEIESLLKSIGITPRIAVDDEYGCSCPFHEDKHPSFYVNIKSAVFYCHSCGAKGSMAFLVSQLTGQSYSSAVVQVNEQLGSSRIYAWREDYDNVSFSPMALKVSTADMALFCDPPYDALLSKNITLESTRLYNIRWNSSHESWIFPFYDPYTNELWGWQEKNARIFRNFPTGTKKSRTLFGLGNLEHGSTGILVESPVDTAVLHSAGITGGISSFGIPKGSYQLSLVQHRCDRIVLALDNDTAGSTATRDLVPVAVQMFNEVYIFNYKDSGAKDPGEMSYDEIRYGMETAWHYLDWIDNGR